MTPIALTDWLAPQSPALVATLLALVGCCAHISERAAVGPLGEGEAADEGSEALAACADRCLGEALAACPHVAGYASGAREQPFVSDWHGESGEYLVIFEPLDATPNVEANGAIGTLFSVLPHPFHGTSPGAAGFLQPGRRQAAAGYVIYGPATLLVLSCGQGVAVFRLDRRDGQWRLARERVEVPATTAEFAIDASNQRFWEKPVQRYVAECMAGEDGPRGRNFSMRWVASTVAEVHRIMVRGGVFLYPRDTRQPYKPGHLRLAFEAAPMAFLMEQAGGRAVTGTQELLDVVPDTLHQKACVILGSCDEVQRIVGYHDDPSENVTWQLFKTRSLFVQPQA